MRDASEKQQRPRRLKREVLAHIDRQRAMRTHLCHRADAGDGQPTEANPMKQIVRGIEAEARLTVFTGTCGHRWIGSMLEKPHMTGLGRVLINRGR